MGKRFRILIVEDEAEVSYFLKAALNTNNFEGFVAENGQQAVEFFGSQDFDAILMDINMPVLNGVEATREIRKHPKGKNIPIVILTALEMEEWEQKSREAGASQFLVKPFRSKDVLHCLRTLLENPPGTKSKTSGTKPKRETKLKVHFKTPQGLIQCYLKNLLEGRTFLETPNILPLGSTFHFEITLADANEKPLHVEAVVKWINLYEDSKGMGIEYHFVNPQDEKRILDLMDKVS